MHLRMIRSIYRKDLRDAIRDSRVLVAIIVPIAIGILYNFIFQDTTSVPSANVAWFSDSSSQLLDRIQSNAGDSVKLTFDEKTSADEVRAAVADKDADVGMVIPSGFDAAVSAGSVPRLTVLLPESPGFAGNYVAAAIEPAVRQLAGQAQPASIDISRISAGEATTEAIFDRLGPRRYFVLVALTMEIGMICMLALPIILTEEVEKRTIEALVLVASYLDIIIAKALVGLTYIIVAATLLLSITGIEPERVLLFALAVLGLSVTLIGFGLLIGGLFRSANQLNTWGGVVLLPIIAPAFLVGLPLPVWLLTILDFIPTSQAARVMIDSVSSEPFFSQTWLAFLVMLVWAIAAYALLARQLSRRVA